MSKVRYEDRIIQIFSNGVFAYEASVTRLALSIVASVVFGYSEANYELGLWNYAIHTLMFISAGLIVFESARFGYVCNKRFGGWWSLAAIAGIFIAGRWVHIFVQTYEFEPQHRTASWILFLLAGFVMGVLLKGLRDEDTYEQELED